MTVSHYRGFVSAALDFYDSVKLVNYIRRQVDEKACVKCGEKQGSRKELLDHMQKENHFTPTRDAEFWKNPQYAPPLSSLHRLFFIIPLPVHCLRSFFPIAGT
jgi:Zn ribbon nucleic-acid-binding protein